MKCPKVGRGFDAPDQRRLLVPHLLRFKKVISAPNSQFSEVFVRFWTLFVGVACSHLALASEFHTDIKPLLDQYCLQCHGGDKVKGEIDFTLVKSSADVEARFEWWENVVERLREHDMPPEDEAQPTTEERERIFDWYEERFVASVEAHPGYFRPRRLSAVEYRNTLRTLFGFDLQVNIMEAEQTLVEKSLVLKLLPTDPPGASGFTNDTSGNPLTTLIWSQYSYLVDSALESLFSGEHRDALEALAGPLLGGSFTVRHANRLLESFAERVYRRPAEVIAATFTPDQEDLIENVKSELKALLMAPSFLYRGLSMPKIADRQQSVDAYELAERLSYFLWGDMPDEALLRLAEADALRDSAEVDRQIDRMLQSPKSRHLATDFAWQWLALGDMEQASKQIPYVVAMRSQALDFVHYLFVEDRPLLELIDSKVSFVSPLISKFYRNDRQQMVPYRKQKGIEIEVVPTQRIELSYTPERGGILTMPGVLAMNRGPVLRGVWMLERILGEHLPEPPMDIGQVPANQLGENRSFRERFESHRSRATCAVCHDKIDPLGFATQGYDDRGNFILATHDSSPDEKGHFQDKKGNWVDTSGVMPNGQTFSGFQELKGILKTSYRRQIIRNIVERTLSYALCRKLQLYDRPTVDGMVDALDSKNGTYRELIRLIVNSLPFRETFVKGESS